MTRTAALFLVLQLALSPPAAAEGVKGVLLDEPAPVAPFALTDQDGAPFTEADLSGRWTLVFMGFTQCPDVCPFTLANLEAVRAELSQLMSPDSLPEIVFLAVDPARDREILGEYVRHFGIAFTGVTGPRAEIDSLTASLDGYYRLEPSRDGGLTYDVVHSAAVSVVDPNGAVRAKLSPPFHPYDTAQYLYRLFRGRT